MIEAGIRPNAGNFFPHVLKYSVRNSFDIKVRKGHALVLSDRTRTSQEYLLRAFESARSVGSSADNRNNAA